MWYGEGRIHGNIGTYVIEGPERHSEAKQELQDATRRYDQVHLPKELVKASEAVEASIHQVMGVNDPRQLVMDLGGGVSFLEFFEVPQFDEEEGDSEEPLPPGTKEDWKYQQMIRNKMRARK
jgi:hypothetical protein